MSASAASASRNPAGSLKALTFFSPAKLNLFLEVTGKRPDGYHDILTLFERISLCDRIRLQKTAAKGIALRCSGEKVPGDAGNLAFRAAASLMEACGVRQGVRITLDKQIPVGAGLAGGSSNAATVLEGLNELFGLGLRRDELISFADKLGSDVAFFLLGERFALGKGRGNELQAVPGLRRARLWHLLFLLPVQVLTKDVYGLVDKRAPAAGGRKSLRLTRKTPDVNILISQIREKNIVSLNQSIYNRLSETVMKSYSLVSALRDDLLKNGLRFVHMSGSGPTLFATFETRAQALKVRRLLQPRFSHRCRMVLVSTR